jgi:hypothetical protein
VLEIKIKTIEELDNDLCDYCGVDEEKRGVFGGPNGPIYYCNPTTCELAYQNYLGEVEANKS